MHFNILPDVVITNGGPVKSTYLYMMMLYDEAFGNYKMGYASALSWVLFIFIFIVTMLVFRTSDSWVTTRMEGKQYETGKKISLAFTYIILIVVGFIMTYPLCGCSFQHLKQTVRYLPVHPYFRKSLFCPDTLMAERFPVLIRTFYALTFKMIIPTVYLL